jgi:hypothetical protein
VGIDPRISSIPYDLAYLKALVTESVTARGAVVWPGIYAVDVLAKPHYYDDSRSRRELTWSPSVGSFDQEMPQMGSYLAGVTQRPASSVTSPRAGSQKAGEDALPLRAAGVPADPAAWDDVPSSE